MSAQNWNKDAGRWVAVFLVVTAAVALGPSMIMAAGLTVGAGSGMSLGTGKLDLGCNDLVIQNGGELALDSATIIQRHVDNQVGGTIDGGQGSMDVYGDWTNHGTFIPGTSKVSLLDGCGLAMAYITGETTFCELLIASAMGKTVYFEAGKTQTISCSMDFTGVEGKLLVLRSSVPGSAGFVNLEEGATQHHDYENVADLVGTGQHIAPGRPSEFNSVDGGGNYRWFLNIPVPTVSQAGFALLAMLMLFMGWRALRRSSRPAAAA
ncbi:MAG: IPTL-CTERM sorting domain-containing protein [Deltaproteobacteria bacterium]|nr:IPTL-CTERM sorting domain-containing protein [Deltaproteobacteria bacterium]